MPFSSDAIANWFITRSRLEGRPVTPMKLQKLAYFAHGWHLALEQDGEPLISEQVEAWEYGPVIPHMYREFKTLGARPIDRLAVATQFNGGKPTLWHPTIEAEAITPGLDVAFAEAVLTRVWQVYNKFSAGALSDKTHEKGSPWWKVREEARKLYGTTGMMGLNIPNEMIRDWFKQVFQKAAVSTS